MNAGPVRVSGAERNAGLTRPSVVVGLLVLIFCLCYGYELTNFNLSIDEEVLAFYPAKALPLGRWSSQLVLSVLWPTPTTPFGPFLLFGIFGSVGYAILLRAFDVESPRLVHFALFPTFIAFPVWFNQVEFSANVIGDGLAVSACCVAVWLTKNAAGKWQERAAKAGGVVALVAFAVGVYQTFIFLYVVLGVAVSASEKDFAWPVYRRRCGFVVAAGAMGFLASVAIGQIALRAAGETLAPYANSFIHLDQLATSPAAVFATACNQIADVYVRDWLPFGRAGYVFLAAYVLCAALVLFTPQQSSKRAYWLLSLTLIALVPFGFNLFMGGVLPVRTYVAVPASVWCLLFLPLVVSRSLSSRGRIWTERATFAIAVIVFTQILFVQSVVQARTSTVQRRDLLLAGAIYERIGTLRGNMAAPGPVKVLFYGTKPVVSPYPAVPTGTSGASFFEWDDGNSFRIVQYMKFIGFSDLTFANADECRRVRPLFDSMPTWPAQGAVRLEGDIALVKLSDTWARRCK